MTDLISQVLKTNILTYLVDRISNMAILFKQISFLKREDCEGEKVKNCLCLDFMKASHCFVDITNTTISKKDKHKLRRDEIAARITKLIEIEVVLLVMLAFSYFALYSKEKFQINHENLKLIVSKTTETQSIHFWRVLRRMKYL